MTLKITAVMPAYNVEKLIGRTVERIPQNSIHELVIINDGSKDGTGRVASQIKRDGIEVKFIDFEKNRGYGAVQKAGFNAALEGGADVVVLLHSDGQYAPELLPKLLKPFYKEKADVVQGSRMLGGGALKGGMPLYKYLGNRFLTAIENIAYGMDMAEYHSGYMLYSRRALESIPFMKLSDTFHFDGEMLMMAGKKKLKIEEIPIPTKYAEEKSNLKSLQYGIDVLKIVYKYLKGGYDF